MKSKKLKKIYFLFLFTFAAYTLADTFILTKTYAEVDNLNVNTSSLQEIKGTSEEIQYSEKENSSEDYNSMENIRSEINLTQWEDAEIVGEYSSDNLSIIIYKFIENNTTVYTADVKVNSMANFKTAFAENSYGSNITEKTSSIAKEVQAILAINGDFYGAQEKGYVIRNGEAYRDTSNYDEDILVLYQDGNMEVVQAEDFSVEELIERGAWQSWSFGPTIVEDGKIRVSQNEEVGKAMASNPRTAIAMVEKGHYIFIVSDGRTEESEGLSLYQLAEIIEKLGAKTAYNLDGGGSSTMVFKDELINKPTTNGNINERKVSDIIYLGE